MIGMLEALRRIVNEVDNAPDLEQALAIIVGRVKEAVGAETIAVDHDTGPWHAAFRILPQRNVTGKQGPR
jgi:hypothetical protein